MRLLLVIDRFGSGGAQTQIALLARALVDRSCEVDIFTYHTNDFLQAEYLLHGVNLIQTRKRNSLSVLKELAGTMRAADYDGVVAFLAGPSAYASAARMLSGLKGALAVSERNVFAAGRPTCRERLQRIGHFSAEAIVSNSLTQTRLMKVAFPMLSERLKTIHNAVDLNQFKPGLNTFMQSGELLAVGRIVREKNVLGLAKALAKLLSAGHRDLRVRWVGKVHDQEYFDLCCSFLQTQGISEYWTWEGEQVELSGYYQSADWLVLPSFREGMPNVIGEALACGLPCLMSDVSDAQWLMDAGRNGYVFDPNDEWDLANTIEHALGLTAARRLEMSRSARSFAERELSHDVMAARYLQVMGLY